eukprot:GGOE01022594.1.p1 GENE.GGOE01022594.1~~GGOE01022594.1.p1  ORF type:complete len:478 (-),score=118.13 GGOE01022594.1:277-1653(-)
MIDLFADDHSACSDLSITPRCHPLLYYLRCRKPEAFVVEVDASKGITMAEELPNFASVLQRVRSLCKTHSLLAENSTAATSSSQMLNATSLLRAINFHLDNYALLPSPSNHSVGTQSTLEMEAILREPTSDAPTKGFTWISFQTASPEYIARLGRECHHQRQIDSEDMYGNEAHIHVCLFRGWVLTIHNRPSTAIQRALDRLEDEFSSESHPDADLQNGLHTLAHTSWIPYTLADLDVDWMMETAETLVQEAQETEQLMLGTSSKEQSDVLRRISLARSRIYTQRQRNFSKQRLLMVLSSSASESFVAPQMKIYLRDVYDHIQCCSQRLNFAQEVLSQASNNYVAGISIEEAHLANRMNVLLGRLTKECLGILVFIGQDSSTNTPSCSTPHGCPSITLLTVVFIPFNLFGGLFGMNVEVPMRDVRGLGPWCSIVFTGFVFCTMLFLVLNRLDQQQQAQ